MLPHRPAEEQIKAAPSSVALIKTLFESPDRLCPPETLFWPWVEDETREFSVQGCVVRVKW